MTIIYSLSQLGWSTFFQQQLSVDECCDFTPARVIAQHRSQIELLCETHQCTLSITPQMPALTVGDWVLLDSDKRFNRLLSRKTVFTRRASGTKLAEQLIGANVDTVFIVTALNNDFSLNRIERYLALIKEAGADPIVVLTKADLCPQVNVYLEQVRSLDTLLVVEAVNALDSQSIESLISWCKIGNTLAVVGSSGVGKSTLVNTLLASQVQLTGVARDKDDKGRHTTSARHLRMLPQGGAILDTPGMREIQLVDCEQGLQQTFSDIESMALQCRFKDCQHDDQPSCAVQAAIKSGELDERRLISYQKLSREQAHNSANLAEKRAKEKSQSRFYRSVQDSSRRRKKGD